MLSLGSRKCEASAVGSRLRLGGWSRAAAFAVGALLVILGGQGAASAAANDPASFQGSTSPAKPNIVLVPGAYEDGSVWSRVVRLLQDKGFRVTVVPIPLTSLDADVAMTRSVLARQTGPTILVGHSWGGVVITEAGNAPNVAGLVYVAAVAPDVGGSSGDLIDRYPPPAKSRIVADASGMKWFDTDSYPEIQAGDVNIAEARVLAAVQRPISTASFTAKVTQAAWKSKPTWYAVSTKDMVQTPDMQRFIAKRMGATTIEIPASHMSPLSHPEEVANLILDAAEKAGATKPNAGR